MKRLSEKMSNPESQNHEKGPNGHSFGYKATKIAAAIAIPVFMMGSFDGCQTIKGFFNGSGSSDINGSGNNVDSINGEGSTTIPNTTINGESSTTIPNTTTNGETTTNLSLTTRYETTTRPHTTRPPITTTRPPETTATSEMQEKMNLAPNLNGAVKEIKERNGYDRVVYDAKAGNPYGVEAGTYLGEFKKEVNLGNSEVGGVALIPVVAEKLLKNGLANMSGSKWMVFVPADISELKENTVVDMKVVDYSSEYKDALLKVNFGGQTVSISNPVSDSSKLTGNAMHMDYNGVEYNSIMAAYHLANGVITQNGVSVNGKFKFSEIFTEGKLIPFGEKMTTTSDFIFICANSYTEAGVISESRILENNGCPVFVIDK